MIKSACHTGYVFLIILLSINWASGQELQDSVVVVDQNQTTADEDKPRFKDLFKGPPGKAFLYSAILPGAGQFYNKRYWKVPIVYAALGTTIYVLLDNRSEFNRFDDAYRMRVDLGDNSMDEFQGILSLSQINNFRKEWEKNVQRAYITLGLMYFIQASEAFVDRHLMDFDISDDLSLKMKWHLQPTGVGITCAIDRPTRPTALIPILH